LERVLGDRASEIQGVSKIGVFDQYLVLFRKRYMIYGHIVTMEDEQERVRSIEWCHDSIQGQAILNVKYLESGAIIEGRMSYDDDGHGDDDDDVYCVLNGVIFNDLG